MFSTLGSRIILGIYILILLSIPIGSYLVAQSRETVGTNNTKEQTPKSTAKITPRPTFAPAKDLLESAKAALGANTSISPTPAPSGTNSPEIATNFGPTLSFSVSLEGRPKDNQAVKMFVGIVEGTLMANPKFLLSFTVDLPTSGTYSNLSLAGLNPGSTYTALLKGSAQIATSSAFTMSPAVSNLNDGQPINLLSGDLNEDNVINSADYAIAQKLAGVIPTSPNWNDNADLNKDGIINAFDLGIISKHLNITGESGAWTSPIPKTATPSAGLSSPSVGGPNRESGPPSREAGHWIWIPNL